MRTYTEYDLVQELCDPSTVNRATSHLYEKYFEGICILSHKMGGTIEDAEDIFQDVVVAFIDKAVNDEYDPYGEAALSTYLNRMAYFLLNKRLEREPKQAIWERKFAERYLKQGNPEADYNNRMTATALLDKLCPPCKSLLQAYYIDGIDLEELGETENVSAATMGQRLRRCLQKLKIDSKKWKSKK